MRSIYSLKNKKVVVAGLGKSGIAAAHLALEKGASVWVTEREDSPRTQKEAGALSRDGAFVELGHHSEEFVKGKDIMVISPGISPAGRVIRTARRYNVPVISELELSSMFLKRPLICITGTNGKSTVTAMVSHILRCSGLNAPACGNIGVPLGSVILHEKLIDTAVVETSSFQLKYTRYIRPHISAWLNFSRDHMDYHTSIDDYMKSKLRIFANQTEKDYAVINKTDAHIVKGIKAQKIFFSEAYGNAAHPGAIPAGAICRIYGVTDEHICRSIETFTPLPHRMEYITQINGISFINDSKATNPAGVLFALERVNPPAALILGGRDKGGDFTTLKKALREKTAFVIVTGEAQDIIRRQLGRVITVFSAGSIEEAAETAYKNAHRGTTVLLSPGCSSFDAFPGYKERGMRFREAVEKIARGTAAPQTQKNSFIGI